MKGKIETKIYMKKSKIFSNFFSFWPIPNGS